MLYLTVAFLVDKYHVSDRTVRNWIKETKSGKLNLDLDEDPQGTRILNSTGNIAIIEDLVEKRKKFRNNRGSRTISPKPEFYNLYTPQQILDISSNLDIRREIPFQYGYFDGGADYWDKYAQRLVAENVPNILTSTIRQLKNSLDYIDDALSDYEHVNVIDIGPGNSLPVKDLLQHFLDQGKLGRYIAVDISDSMLKIARQNIAAWFGSKVVYEEYKADVNYDRFAELLSDNVIGEGAGATINVVLALGGTFANLYSPDNAFRVIRDSMNRDDLFIYNRKLDSETARNYFDFRVDKQVQPLDAKAKMVLDFLNLEESLYDVEMGFDETHRERFIRIRLKLALTIKFAFAKGERKVEFHKNDTILLWRSWHQNMQEVLQQLDRTDFDILQTSLTQDKSYILTVSRVKSQH